MQADVEALLVNRAGRARDYFIAPNRRHPWNQTTIPKPQKRDFGGNYTWVMSPRWPDKRTGDHLALDGLVDIGYVKAPGDKTVRIRLPKTGTTNATSRRD